MHRAMQAMLDALCWALRNPKHALPPAPPLAQPPAEASTEPAKPPASERPQRHTRSMTPAPPSAPRKPAA